MSFATIQNRPAPDSEVGPTIYVHLVCIGMDSTGEKSLRIHVRGRTLKSNSRYTAFYVDTHTMTARREPRVPIAKHTIVELGRFTNAALFTFVCMNQPIQNSVGSVFDDWVRQVLATMEALHSMSWTPRNDL